MEQVEENDTLLVRLRKLANQKPDKTAFLFVDKDLNERVITRKQIWDRTQKCAAIFKRLGLRKGNVICNTLVNSPERLISYFGSLATGATPSQGQLFLADGTDLIHNLKESRSSAIIYDPRDTNGAGHILKKIKYVDEATGATCYKDLPNLKIEIEIEAKGLDEGQRWMNTIDKEKEMFVEEDISSNEIAMVFVTSGTTGFSKLVPHPHSSLIKVIRGFEDSGGFSEDGSLFNMQSLGWLGGFPAYYASFGCVRILTDLTNGPPEKMGEFLISIFNQHSPRSGFLIARDNQSVLDAINAGHKLYKQLNILFTGGGPVNNATMEALGKITHKVLAVYGGTEFLIVSAKEVNTKADFKDMCAGPPRNCEVRIVGEDERELPSGEQGEILMRSGSVFKGYLNNPAKTAASFTEDGWYKTGDIGYFDMKGDLFVLCRKADAINKDGFIHYPGWMEQLINKHPALEKVAVIGIPDPVHHEEICLCYKTVAGSEVTADDLREYCKTLFLTRQNDKMSPVPKHYLPFDDFIVNTNGKLDRKKMREEILKLLNR